MSNDFVKQMKTVTERLSFTTVICFLRNVFNPHRMIKYLVFDFDQAKSPLTSFPPVEQDLL